MYVKIHKSATGEVVAVCDKNLLDKTFEEGRYQLKVSAYFYKGEEKNETEVIQILKNACNTNLVGKEAVAAGLKAGVISQANILRIAGIPHAQAYTC